MASKVELIVLVTLCLGQMNILAHGNDLSPVSFSEIGFVRNLIKEAYKNALKQIDDIEKQLKEKSHETLENGYNTTNSKFSDLDDKKKEIQNEMNNSNNTEKKDCLDRKIGEYFQIKLKLINDLSECVNEKFEEAQKIIDNTKRDITNIYRKIKKHLNNLESCGLLNIFCFTKYSAEVPWTVITHTPQLLLDSVGQVTYLGVKLIPSIAICGTINYGQSLIKCGQIISDTVKCSLGEIDEN